MSYNLLKKIVFLLFIFPSSMNIVEGFAYSIFQIYATEISNFTEEEIEAVWKKAYPQESNAPYSKRKEVFSAK